MPYLNPGEYLVFFCELWKELPGPEFLVRIADRITRAFNRCGATRVVALDISKAFDWSSSQT